MTDFDEEPTLSRDDDDSRYELHYGDTLAAYTIFVRDYKDRLVFPHTEVDPAFQGRGLAKKVVEYAMADAAAAGATIVPLCPFVQGYLRKNDVPGLTIEWPPSAHHE